MARPGVRVVALYKPEADEVFQVVVELADADFPDALHSTTRAATRGVRDMLADALTLEPDTTDNQWAEMVAAAEVEGGTADDDD